MTFRELNPIAAMEWDYERNGDLTPDNVGGMSEKEVYFVCKNNHKWKTKVRYRTSNKGKNVECSYCSGHRTIPGETDFLAVCKNAVDFWDFETNKDLDPTQLLPKSNKEVNFRCPKGHTFKKKINDFTDHPNCPKCLSKNGLQKSLSEVNPIAAKQWNYDLNGELSPDDIASQSKFTAHFICLTNPKHEWTQSIRNRTRKNRKNVDCPYCSGRKVIPRETDFFAICKEAIDLWDFNKNLNIDPYNLLPHARTKVNFKCTNGHEFTNDIRSFTRSPHCPICHSEEKKDFLEKNSLKVLYPNLVKDEWNYISNALLADPNKIFPHSIQPFFWKCSKCGSAYIATPKLRVENHIRKVETCKNCRGVRTQFTNY